MSSIADLFQLGDDDAPFDPQSLNAHLDSIISGHRSRMGAENLPPNGGDEPPAPGGEVPPEGEPAPVDGAGDETGIPNPIPPQSAPPADPFGELDPERRNELAVITRALNDPERADAIRRGYLGVEPPAAVGSGVPAPTAAPPEPELPDHITPQSFEADLWRQNLTLQRRLDQMEQATAQVQQATVLDRARAAAEAATGRFVQRYGQVLSAPEIEAICKIAGQRHLPDAMIAARGGHDTPGAAEAGMYEALEFVLRSTDSLLGRVLNPGVQPPPPVASPVAPALAPTITEAKRVLSALSTGASPVGAPALRQPIQIDHAGGGRMTEISRRALVEQAVADLRGQELN